MTDPAIDLIETAMRDVRVVVCPRCGGIGETLTGICPTCGSHGLTTTNEREVSDDDRGATSHTGGP